MFLERTQTSRSTLLFSDRRQLCKIKTEAENSVSYETIAKSYLRVTFSLKRQFLKDFSSLFY